MNSYNPFGTTSLFGNNNNATTSTNNNSLFGANNNNNNNSPLFGANNNNNTTASNFTFGTNNTNPTSSLFGANNNTSNNAPLFGNNNANNNNPGFFNNNNNQNNLFGNNNNNQNNNNPNNIIGNLSGINNNNNVFGNNGNNNNQQNNIINQNNFLNLNDPKIQHDLMEYQQVLINIQKCCNPSEKENMFKDYLYMPIRKGEQPSEVNVYRPYTYSTNQELVINDYNIWEEGNKKNKNPNEFFPVQISSVDHLLSRNKLLENGILLNISNTVETEKSLEILNKKIEDEMNNKLLDIKNCHLKLDELELSLSSKVAQYNYLIGTAKENVSATQEIKDNIKKTNDNIDKNNMMELCDKIKKSSNENFGGENHNYIKDMNKEKINAMLDALVEIQNMMNVICNNNKKNLDILNGMQREVDRILKKNEI